MRQATAEKRQGVGRVTLVGNPNVGKSVLFGLLTGRYTTVSNYPGTTVEVSQGNMALGDRAVSVIDTPGANSLIPQSEDERVTRDLLLESPSTVLQVADAKNLARGLALTIQLAEAGRPTVLCLNMSDEADVRGLQIDTDKLAGIVGVEVVRTVATRRQGTSRLAGALDSARVPGLSVDYGAAIEQALSRIAPLMPEAPMARRALALAALAGDDSLAVWLRGRLPADALEGVEAARRDLAVALGTSPAYAIQDRRLKAAERVVRHVQSENGRRRLFPVGRLAALTMHPLWGIPVVAIVLYLIYLFVGVVGAQTFVGWLEEDLFGVQGEVVEVTHDGRGNLAADPVPSAESADPPTAATVTVRWRPWEAAGAGESPSEAAEGRQLISVEPSSALAGTPRRDGGEWRIPLREGVPATVRAESWSGMLNPSLKSAFLAWSPSVFLTDLLVGPYGLITMGLTYAIAIVLPIVATFFLCFSILEDSGYLPRLAVMMNRLFRVMGLNGRAVLPMVLGLGCDTMATLTTRILPARRDRLIVIILLALGVPCSAQLGVVLGMLAGLSWKATVVWVGAVAGVILLVGFLASRILPGQRSEFILEIPPLRMPSPANLARKTLARVEWYLKEAVPLFLLGTLVLFLADRTGALRVVKAAVSPITTALLGLPEAASEAFIIGFLRRDFGAAGLFRLASRGEMDAIQIVVSLVTITLFIPCIANLFMIVKEQGAKVAAAVGAFIFPFAILVGAVLNALLRAFRVELL